MHSAVRALPGYNRHDAPAILMDGPSIARETEQGRAVTAQLAAPARRRSARRCTPRWSRLAAAAHPEGHPPPGPRRLRGLLLQPARPGAGARARPARAAAADLEPMPDADVQGARGPRRARRRRRVRGPQRALGRGSSTVEDLRRRVEDDCPEALVLPPREHYGVEAISQVRGARATTAGRTSSTSGPRTARRSCTSRASWHDGRRPLPRLAQRHPAVAAATAVTDSLVSATPML